MDGELWLHDGSGVAGRVVKVKVNQTEYALQTDSNGYFAKTLDLTSIDNKPTLYIVTATFEGDQPLNATAWAYTLEGTKYPACTTTQHGYKPVSNCTTLTVTPQATDTTTQTKTPEEMQQRR